MRSITIIFILSTIHLFGQNKSSYLVGTYYSVDNKFERWSIMKLMDNDKFVYDFGLGDCSAKISGTYIDVKNRIRFKNSIEFTKEYIKTQNDSIYNIEPSLKWIGYSMYPDLSLSEWKINRTWIKPIYPIDCGCLIEKGKHKKNKNTC